MKLTPPSSKPAIPHVKPGQKEIAVDFIAPRAEDTLIGHIPQDHYTKASAGGAALNAVHVMIPTDPVYRDQPVLGNDNMPIYDKKRWSIDLRPYSKLNWGALGAAVGGSLAGLAGFGIAAAGAVALAPVTIAAAVGGAAVGAAIGVYSVAGDKVSLDFRRKDVVRHELNGHDYHRTEKSSRDPKTNEKTVHGYNHWFTPRVSEHQIGNATYWEPYARHSTDHD